MAGILSSEPKPVVQTAVAAPAAAATLVTEAPKKKPGDTRRARGARAASILTTDIEDARLGG